MLYQGHALQVPNGLQVLTESEWGLSRWAEEHVYDWTNESFVMTWGCAGSGKAQPLDSRVYTPTGPSTMGALRVGDRVVAQDGQTAEVIATHEVGLKEEYRVSFVDGSETLCAGDHLWEVVPRGGSWSRNHVVTTDWLARREHPGDYGIPFCGAVYFRERSVPVPPYLMGALLGDGCLGGASGDGNLRLSAADPDIVAACRSLLDPEYELAVIRGSDYGLVKRSRAHGSPNRYIRAFKAVGLWGKLSPEKFVPADYLYNSVENRSALLAGLMDTDGCCSGHPTFSSTSLRLASDVRWLVLSLGGRASLSVRQPHTVFPDGSRKAGLPSYLVSMSLPPGPVPFRCRRKAEAYAALPSRRVMRSRRFHKIERTGRTVPMKCITIDHPRGLYLTDDFIATHNSNDYGLLALVDWMVDPDATITLMASTTKDAMLKRNFAAVIHYLRLFRSKNLGLPGIESTVRTAVVLSKDDSANASPKCGLHGLAIKEGPIAEAVGRIRGMHAPYVRGVFDEVSQMHPAVLAPSLLLNLKVGTKDFKVVGLTNIDSFDDLAGRNSEPIGGWGTGGVNEDVEEWRTTRGKVRRHDGFKSPAIVEPDGAKKYPYLLNQETLDEMIKAEGGNADSPAIWTMIRAWPKTIIGKATVLTPDEARLWGMQESGLVPRWLKRPTLVAGLDPGFGGDHCILQFAWCGLLADSSYVIWAEKTPRLIPIRASAADKTVMDQILDYVLPACQSSGLLPEHLGVDDTGTQGVADAIASAWSNKILRFSFGGKASERPVSAFNTRLAKDVYTDTATELACLIKEFGRYRQLKDVPDAVISQATRREILRRKGGKFALQTKDEYKKVTGLKSPNEFDAFIMCLGVARERLNVMPGGSEMVPLGPVEATLDDPWTPSDIAKYNNLETDYTSI